jgi:D-alanyl-D-alanine carboxypeptidase
MQNTFRLLLLVGFFVAPFHLFAQASQTHKMDLGRLPQKIDSLIATTTVRPFNGVCIIAKDGKVLHSISNGFADRVEKTGFSTTDQFIVGSLSKQITAVLVLQACQKGLIDLNTPIKKYLPDLKETWSDSVTVHQLLNHTSGVVGFGRPLAFKAGSSFSYSNTGYAVLGQIAAAANKTTYEKLVNALFKRCKMKHSAFPTEKNTAHLLTAYVQKEGKIQASKYEIHPDFAAAAGLMTTPQDLVIWNTMLHSGKLLNTDFYTKMTTPTTVRDHPIFGNVPYAYALQMAQGDGITEIGHGGYATGFVSINFYYPKEKISLIVLENIDWQSKDMKENFVFETQIRAFLRASFVKK